MILIDLRLKQSQMAEHKVVSPRSSRVEGVPSTPWKRAAVKLFAEDVLTGAPHCWACFASVSHKAEEDAVREMSC